MRKKPSKFLEKHRIKTGVLKSDKSYGNNGAFEVPFRHFKLTVIASDQGGWDHVSVSHPTFTPTWKMMCFVKDLFFREDEVVVQYHPKKDDYINLHKHCLHMWRPQGIAVPTPPNWMVGPK